SRLFTTLMARSSLNARCLARYTTAMPPAPIFSRIWYLSRITIPVRSSDITRRTDWSLGQVWNSFGYVVLHASQYFMSRRSSVDVLVRPGRIPQWHTGHAHTCKQAHTGCRSGNAGRSLGVWGRCAESYLWLAARIQREKR